MKQTETDKKTIAMILCFVYSGIALILFLISLIIIFKQGNVIAFDSFVDTQIALITSQVLYTVSWVIALFSLFGLIVSFLAGRELQKQDNGAKIKREVQSEQAPETKTIDIDMLMPDEVKIVKILEENGKSMTQNELVKASDMSKVKVHRIIKRLEGKKVISKHDYGMTNRIKLEKSLRSEEDE